MEVFGILWQNLERENEIPDVTIGEYKHKGFTHLRTSEIHLFYNLQLFYWHFLEILWLFIFLVLYQYELQEMKQKDAGS